MGVNEKTGRHSAGRAHYAGRIDDITGQLRGPTTYGSVLIAERQDFDGSTGRTVVEFSHATPEDIARSR